MGFITSVALDATLLGVFWNLETVAPMFTDSAPMAATAANISWWFKLLLVSFVIGQVIKDPTDSKEK